MKQNISILVFGIFLCIAGLFVEKNYIKSYFVIKIPVEKEQQFFTKVFGENLEKSPDTIKDKKILKEFNSITDRLITKLPKSEYNYKIIIKKSPEVNAYTYAGGYIIVNTGLIKFTNNAEELLAVLAHEIGHVNKRHVFNSMVNQLGMTALVSLVFGDVAGISSYLASAGANMLQYKFSRDYEKEADLEAVRYMNVAQINSNHFIDFFQRLEKTKSPNKEFLSTHPLNENRENYIKDYIKQNQIPDFAPLDVDYKKFKSLF